MLVTTRRFTSELELYQRYETREGKTVRVDIEESKNLASSMPEKTQELNAQLTGILTEMNTCDSYFNPSYQGDLPQKDKVPAVTSEERVGNVVRATFKENGAKVVRAQLMDTTLGGEPNEEWFSERADIEDGTAVATLPKGTMPYIFNIIDEKNNYLVSHPKVNSQAQDKSKHQYSDDALSARR